MSPPPHYANLHGISQQDTGPSNTNMNNTYQQPYLPPGSPAPHDANKIQPYGENQNYNQNQSNIYPPDPAYGGAGGYYNGPQGPPPQGYYAPGPGQQMAGGYYGQPGMQVPPQGMYYQQQGPMYGYPQQQPYGYYPQDRGMGGSGICAGLLGALACCCCLDMMF